MNLQKKIWRCFILNKETITLISCENEKNQKLDTFENIIVFTVIGFRNTIR